MAVWSFIKKSQLEGANRLDAEYYQPEYLRKMEELNSVQTDRLGDIAYVTDGEHGSPIWDENSGIKYFSAQHVREGIIDDTEVNTISQIIDNKNKRSRLQKGDILLSTVGTIGFAALVKENLLPANIDRHVARIALKPNTLDPEFLIAFLNSSYGKFQSIRESTGNVQLNLFIDKIVEFRVPRSNSPNIASLVKGALEEFDNSEVIYKEVEHLLLQELGLADFQISDDLAFEVNFSKIKNAGRMDADYFQPKYEVLISKLKGQHVKPLLEVIKNVAANFNPSMKSEEHFKYVELANINASIGAIDGYSEVSGKEAPSRAKRVLDVGDVIVSSVEGSLEKVALVDEEQKGYLASTGFFQFRSDEILPEVLLILAKSIIFHMQLEKETAGTILTAVPKDAIKNIFVPVLPMRVQQRIAGLVRKSHEARKKSKELLEEAKRKVEEMIESKHV